MAYALITNDIDPYYRDIVTILALPYGAQYRFRYERRSGGFDLLGDLRAESIKRAAGVIVFRHRSTGKLVAIRRIRITEAITSAYLVVLEFSVLEFPDYRLLHASELLEQEVDRAATQNEPGGVLRPLVIELPDSALDGILGQPATPIDARENIDRWRSIIDAICKFEFMAKSYFLFAHTILEDQFTLPLNALQHGRVLVNTHSVYEVQVASYSYPPMGGKDADAFDAIAECPLALKSDNAVIAAIRDTSAVVSRYDNHRFSFRAKAGIEGVGTSVSIGPTSVPAGIFVPTILLLVSGRFAGWQWLSLVAGAALYLGSFATQNVWHGLMQTFGIILIAIFGKDSAAALAKIVWNSPPLRDLRHAMQEMSQ